MNEAHSFLVIMAPNLIQKSVILHTFHVRNVTFNFGLKTQNYVLIFRFLFFNYYYPFLYPCGVGSQGYS